MRIEIQRGAMALLRSLGPEGRPIWLAIESLRSDPHPAEASASKERPGRLEMHVKVGLQGYWIGWEIRQDRGETVIRGMVIEEN
jgi:hypothetical protein